MSEYDGKAQDSSGLGWVIIVAAALVFVTMPVTIGVIKYVL